MKLGPVCIFIAVAFVAVVGAARNGRHRPSMTDSSNQAMGDPVDSSSMHESNGQMNSRPSGGRFVRPKGKGRGKDKGAHQVMHETTEMPETPSMYPTTMPESGDMGNQNHPDHSMQGMPDHSTSMDPDHPMSKTPRPVDSNTGDMMPSTTSMPMMMTTTTSAPHSDGMNMFPDLNTVEELQKKQAEEHEKIIAVYKSFKAWVDFLSTNIKGGTLNPVLTRRILEDIRAYQSIILSPHPHKPYNPPQPCDPMRDVWCPETSQRVIPIPRLPLPSYHSISPKRIYKTKPSSLVFL